MRFPGIFFFCGIVWFTVLTHAVTRLKPMTSLKYIVSLANSKGAGRAETQANRR